MASETNELTFVRCPSCRSLVPASAVRCRICNNPLEAAAKSGDTSEAPKAGGRVRQKTISADADEVLQITSEANDHNFSTPPPAPVATHAEDSGDDSDPLSAYLQELEEDTAPTASGQSSVAPAVIEEPADEFDDLFGDMHDLEDEGDGEKVQAVSPALSPDIGLDREDDFDAVPAVSHEEPLRTSAKGGYERASEVESREAPVAVQAPPKRDSQPTQRQAQPFRLEKRPGGAQVARPQPERNNRPQGGERPSEGRKENRGGAVSAPRPERNDRPREEPRKPKQEQTARPSDRPQRREPDSQPQRSEVVHEPRAEVASGGPKMGRMRPGRLFGWLVSFESADGRAIELREGKFFVTATSIRGTDLVIEDPSISTPHAMMSVSTEHGLLIQDLMSDRGVFVRSGERGQYRREDGVFEVRHGDWVRFGDVEFLVTVVPAGN